MSEHLEGQRQVPFPGGAPGFFGGLKEQLLLKLRLAVPHLLLEGVVHSTTPGWASTWAEGSSPAVLLSLLLCALRVTARSFWTE